MAKKKKKGRSHLKPPDIITINTLPFLFCKRKHFVSVVSFLRVYGLMFHSVSAELTVILQGRSAVGPRWAVALPVGKGADLIAKYKHVQYIYTTQHAVPAFAIP